MADAIKALVNATNALKKEKADLQARIKEIDKALKGSGTTTAKPKKRKKAKKAKRGKKKTAAQKKKQSLAMKKAWAKRKKKSKK